MRCHISKSHPIFYTYWLTGFNKITGNRQIGYSWHCVIDDYGTLVPVSKEH